MGFASGRESGAGGSARGELIVAKRKGKRKSPKFAYGELDAFHDFLKMQIQDWIYELVVRDLRANDGADGKILERVTLDKWSRFVKDLYEALKLCKPAGIDEKAYENMFFDILKKNMIKCNPEAVFRAAMKVDAERV